MSYLDEVNREIRNLLRREGGFVDRPEDRGGPTKFGITIGTLSRFLGRTASRSDVEGLTEEAAAEIYRAMAYDPAFPPIGSPAVFGLFLDCWVLHGASGSAKILQRALATKPDGFIGPVTRAALAAAEPGRLYRRLLAERFRFLGRLISGDHADADRDGITDTAENASGWLNRFAEFVENCPA